MLPKMRLYRINLLIEAVERKRERKEACLLQTSLSLTTYCQPVSRVSDVIMIAYAVTVRCLSHESTPYRFDRHSHKSMYSML